MLFDRTEHEPEEYDPEEEFRDPDNDSLTIPSVSNETTDTDDEPAVSIPEVSTAGDEMDVPAELLKHFWALVLVLNGAILAAALALLFLFFEGTTTRAFGSIAAAIVLSGFAYRRYQAYERLDVHDDSELAPDEPDDVTATSDETAGVDTDSGSNTEPADGSDSGAATDSAPPTTSEAEADSDADVDAETDLPVDADDRNSNP